MSVARVGVAMMVVSLAGTTLGVHRILSGSRSRERLLPARVDRSADFRASGTYLTDGGGEAEVAVFLDFECPACRVLARTLSGMALNDRNLSITVHHWPLTSTHPAAMPAAAAAECASLQGAFHRMHDELFAAQDSLEHADFVDLAARAGVADLAAYRRCLDAGTGIARVTDDMRASRTLHLRATPAILVGDSLYYGALADTVITRKLATWRSLNAHGR